MRLVLLALALAAGVSEAQTYPQRPVRMIVPFAPGGTTDALGRVIRAEAARWRELATMAGVKDE